MGRHGQRTPLPDKRFFALLTWTIIMSIIVLGSVLALVHPEV